MILDFSKAYVVKNLQYLTTGLKWRGIFWVFTEQVLQ